MATYIVKTSEMRQKAALITQGLRAGDSFVLIHYKEPVGYISSEVPMKRYEYREVKQLNHIDSSAAGPL
jgi:hypothetical protein